MKNALRPALVVPLMMLVACNDRSPAAADFAPTTPSEATGAAAGGDAPVPLAQDERSRPLSAASDCNLERWNGSRFSGEPVSVAASGTVELSGWLADTATQSVPESFELRMIGAGSNRAWKVVGHTGQPRADVQSLLGGTVAYANPGYVLTLAPASLPHDSYRMYVVYEGRDGLMSCDNGRSIVVGD